MRAISASRRSIVAPGGELARGLLGAPRVPGPVEEAAAAGLELEHRGADRLQEPAVVGDQDDRRVDLDAGSPRATRASRCRGGWSARRAAAGRASRRAPGRARRGSARRRRRSPASGRARSRRSRARAGRRPRRRASDSRRRARAAPGRRRRRRGSPRRRAPRPSSPRAARARPRSRGSSRARSMTYSRRVDSPRGGRWSWSATRTPLPSAIVPSSSARLAGEHPQQGRLAAAVAARERHPVAALELERDVARTASGRRSCFVRPEAVTTGNGWSGSDGRGLLGRVLAHLERASRSRRRRRRSGC